MIKIKLFERLKENPFQTYEFPKFIDNQCEGWIYRISDNDAAKIPNTILNIGREMKIARMLYESGISVPKLKGWEYVKVPQEFDKPRKAFIMEFIEGRNGCELYQGKYSNFEKYELAVRLAEEEIEKAKQLGFNLGFDEGNSSNYILTPNKKIKLIDFSAWFHPDVPEQKVIFRKGKIVHENFVNPDSVFWPNKGVR